MSKLVVESSVTLDGVMQSPGIPDEDTSGGFGYGGWLVPHFDEGLERIQQPADALLIGRRTYEIFAAFWPQVPAEDPMAAMMNNIPKYVASRTLDEVGWTNTTLLKGDVVEAVTKLKQDGDIEIQVPGSGNLVQTLIKHDLVDEFRLTIFPVLLGKGKRLFADGTVPAGLKLTESFTTKTGVIAARYERDGELKTGSFAME